MYKFHRAEFEGNPLNFHQRDFCATSDLTKNKRIRILSVYV